MTRLRFVLLTVGLLFSRMGVGRIAPLFRPGRIARAPAGSGYFANGMYC